MSYLIAKSIKYAPVLFFMIFYVLGFIRYRKGHLVCIFFIPYEGLALLNIGVSCYCVLGYGLGRYTRDMISHESMWNYVHYKKYLVMIIASLFLSLIVCFLRGDVSGIDFAGVETSTTWPLIRYMTNIFASIMLYILICKDMKTYNDIYNAITAFVLSWSYVFITWFGSFIFHLNLPIFLQTKYAGTYGRGGAFFLLRFAGYTGEYGLQCEYFIMIIAFSLILLFSARNKLGKILSIATIAISIPMAISTGTRAFLVIIALFSLFLFYLGNRSGKVSIGKKLLITFVIILLLSGIAYRMTGSLLETRARETITSAPSVTKNASKLETILNRNYIAAFSTIYDIVGFMGIGPLNIPGVGGIAFCWHSLYYDLYIKFGFIGLFIYLIFYSRLLFDLYRKVRMKDNKDSLAAIILFSLFLPLIIGEYARSYQNQTSFILMYWFLFAIIACTNKLNPQSSPDLSK